jgi:MFS family permease
MVAAVALLFRYSDFVVSLGGREQHLGWIVGVGMLGSLSMRLLLGSWIDRYGPRIVWTMALVGFILGCLAHHWLTQVDGAGIYFWRIVLQTSIAGVYGASIAFVSARAPIERLAEVVGTLGTSGFLGTLCGTLLSDLVAANASHEAMFTGSAILGACSLVCTWFGARNAVRHSQHHHLPTWQVLRKYQPGPLLIVAAAMGFGLSLPTVFVRPFAASIGVASISWFFTVYTLTAFGTRLALRRVVDQYGTRTMALIGLTALLCGMLCFIPITKPWQFVVPALLIGAAHAMLFPAATAGVSRAFPARHRGLATTLTMTLFDFGAFVGSPLCGGLLWLAEKQGWPPYPTMFGLVAMIMTLCAIAYGFATRRATALAHAQ